MAGGPPAAAGPTPAPAARHPHEFPLRGRTELEAAAGQFCTLAHVAQPCRIRAQRAGPATIVDHFDLVPRRAVAPVRGVARHAQLLRPGMPKHVGTGFLDDAEQRRGLLGRQQIGVLEVQACDETRLALQRLQMVFQRGLQAQFVEQGRAQFRRNLTGRADGLVGHALQLIDQRLDLGRQTGPQRERQHFDGRAELADLVMHLPGQPAALVFDAALRLDGEAADARQGQAQGLRAQGDLLLQAGIGITQGGLRPVTQPAFPQHQGQGYTAHHEPHRRQQAGEPRGALADGGRGRISRRHGGLLLTPELFDLEAQFVHDPLALHVAAEVRRPGLPGARYEAALDGGAGLAQPLVDQGVEPGQHEAVGTAPWNAPVHRAARIAELTQRFFVGPQEGLLAGDEKAALAGLHIHEQREQVLQLGLCAQGVAAFGIPVDQVVQAQRRPHCRPDKCQEGSHQQAHRQPRIAHPRSLAIHVPWGSAMPAATQDRTCQTPTPPKRACPSVYDSAVREALPQARPWGTRKSRGCAGGARNGSYGAEAP